MLVLSLIDSDVEREEEEEREESDINAKAYIHPHCRLEPSNFLSTWGADNDLLERRELGRRTVRLLMQS